MACALEIGGIAVVVGAVTGTAGARIVQNVAVSSAIGAWELTWYPSKRFSRKDGAEIRCGVWAASHRYSVILPSPVPSRPDCWALEASDDDHDDVLASAVGAGRVLATCVPA